MTDLDLPIDAVLAIGAWYESQLVDPLVRQVLALDPLDDGYEQRVAFLCSTAVGCNEVAALLASPRRDAAIDAVDPADNDTFSGLIAAAATSALFHDVISRANRLRSEGRA